MHSGFLMDMQYKFSTRYQVIEKVETLDNHGKTKNAQIHQK